MARVLLVALIVLAGFDSAFAQSGGQGFPTILDLFRIKPYRAPDRQQPLQNVPDSADPDGTEANQQVQEALIWLGLYAGPIDGEIGPRSTAAIKQFQKSLQQPETGSLDDAQTKLLKLKAARLSQAVGFSTVVEGVTGIEIGLPSGLLTRRSLQPHGADYFSDADRIQVSLRAFRTRAMITDWVDLLKKELAATQIDYLVARENWFAIAGNAKGQSYYIRFQQEGDRFAGFYILYNSDLPDFATVLSMTSLTFSPFAQTKVLSYRNPDSALLLEAVAAFRKRSPIQVSDRQSPNAPSIYWRYGDSVVALNSIGNDRKFTVEKAGADLVGEGVTKGAVIFQGQRVGPAYSGVAFAFTKGCPTVPYAVRGVIDPSEELVTLSGNMPLRMGSACSSVGMVERQLSFQYMKFGLDDPARTIERPNVTPPVAVGRIDAPPRVQPLPQDRQPSTEGLAQAQTPGADAKSIQPPPKEVDGPASQIILESLEDLLRRTTGKDIEFKRYMVDKKNLTGFRTDMPVLRVIFPERVFFDTDKAVLLKEALPVVQSLATTLRDKNEPVAVFVAGHTDSRGTDDYNMKLSVQRADAVASALVKNGVGSANVFRVGFGKAIPVKPNDSARNMALNRRVEFLVASQPTILAAWAAGNRTLCEGTMDCGGPTGAISIPADPVGREGLTIQIQLPPRATLGQPGAPPRERSALPQETISRPSLGDLMNESHGDRNAE